MVEKTTEVTAADVRAIQELHQSNPHVSAVTIRDQLGLKLDPVVVVRVIEGDFNHLLVEK